MRQKISLLKEKIIAINLIMQSILRYLNKSNWTVRNYFWSLLELIVILQLCQNLSSRTRRKGDISRMWTQHFKSILSDWLHDISHKRIWQHQIKVIWLYNNVRFDISTLIWFGYVVVISSETESELMQNHNLEE